MPADRTTDDRSSTSQGFILEHSRPVAVGLGLGDFDMFTQWEAHGRHLKHEMVVKKKWKKHAHLPFEIVRDNGTVQVVDEGTTLRQGDRSSRPPISLWK